MTLELLERNQPPMRMFILLHQLLQGLGRFEQWFDAHFGWFFTNGMKSSDRASAESFRA